MASAEGRDTITLGGGCFWCTEAVFSELRGVERVEPGYSGGTVPNPSYEAVCTDTTGHAEVLQVKYNPKEISYRQLLQVFFSTHDPTTSNRQGNDVGSQYRSIILFHNEEQRRIAEEVIREIEKERIWGDKPIVTELVPFKAFYKAEDYHHNYFRRNPDKSYCQAVIAPKVSKFRKQFFDMLRSTQSLEPNRTRQAL